MKPGDIGIPLILLIIAIIMFIILGDVMSRIYIFGLFILLVVVYILSYRLLSKKPGG